VPPLSERAALVIVALAALVRIAFIPAFELFPQEAYYYLYSQHPDLSYFDHPPAIGWCLYLATWALGRSVVALRLCSFALTLGTQAAFFALVRRVVPARSRGRMLVLVLTSGLFTVLSLIATPDVPLLLFWTLTLLTLHWAIFEERPIAFLLAGLFAGLAFDSKYPGIMLQLGLVLFLWAAPRRRRLLGTPWPYLCLLIAQLVAWPVYLWNARNGFASFRFQTTHRLAESSGPTLHWLGLFLLAQLVLLGPPLILALGRELVRAMRGLRGATSLAVSEEGERTLFLLAFVLPLLGVCLAGSLFVQVKSNWLMPCYIAGALLIAPRLSRALLFASVGTSLLLHALAALEILLYPVSIPSDDTFYGWSDLAASVEKVERTLPGSFVFSADGYKTSAELSFYLGQKIYGPNILGLPGLQFDYLGDDLGSLAGRDGLFIDSAPFDLTMEPAAAPPKLLAERFRRVTQLDPIVIPKGTRIVRKFYVYHCWGYLGPR
jgi:4-amino-4-deoxy-L-arabinose transferase-like glycosyltransferase